MSELGAARQEKIDVFNARLNEDLTNKRRVQENVALTFSRISPTSVFTYAATELAGTSIKLQSQFLDEAYNYQKVFSDFMAQKTGNSQTGGIRMIFRTIGDDSDEPELLDPSELPVFEFKTQTAGVAFSNSIIDMGLLLLFNVLFFGGAFAAFIKFDLR